MKRDVGGAANVGGGGGGAMLTPPSDWHAVDEAITNSKINPATEKAILTRMVNARAARPIFLPTKQPTAGLKQ